jgi:hypothetical protein
VSIHKINGKYVDHISNIFYKYTVVVVVVVSIHNEMLGVVKCCFVFNAGRVISGTCKGEIQSLVTALMRSWSGAFDALPLTRFGHGKRVPLEDLGHHL